MTAAGRLLTALALLAYGLAAAAAGAQCAMKSAIRQIVEASL